MHADDPDVDVLPPWQALHVDEPAALYVLAAQAGLMYASDPQPKHRNNQWRLSERRISTMQKPRVRQGLAYMRRTRSQAGFGRYRHHRLRYFLVLYPFANRSAVSGARLKTGMRQREIFGLVPVHVLASGEPMAVLK